MINLNKLIDKVNFELVWKELVIYYPDMVHQREKYFEAHKYLLDKEPKENIEEMVIHIDRQDYEEFGGEVDYILELDDKEIAEIGYRVHGKNNSSDCDGYWDISAAEWGDWLGYYIHDGVIGFLSNEQIVALCIYEMTYHGLTESAVINWANNIGINSDN
jgi:hypothetical protein